MMRNKKSLVGCLNGRAGIRTRVLCPFGFPPENVTLHIHQLARLWNIPLFEALENMSGGCCPLNTRYHGPVGAYFESQSVVIVVA